MGKKNFKESAKKVLTENNLNKIAINPEIVDDDNLMADDKSLDNQFNFVNAQFGAAVKLIKRLSAVVKQNMYEVALTVKKIYDEKLYVDDGYKNIYDCCEKIFGYKKAFINSMIRVAAYLTDNNKTIYANNDGDFSLSQMQELLPLPQSTVKQMVDSGEITFDMTTKDIRDKVKTIRGNSGNSKVQKIKKSSADNKFSQEEIENIVKENELLRKENAMLLAEIARLQKYMSM